MKTLSKLQLLLISLICIPGFIYAQWDAVHFDERNTFSRVTAINPMSAVAIGIEPNNYTFFILRTNDGGTTWDSIPVNSASNTFILQSIFFADASNGFSGGQKNGTQALLKTTDNAATWIEVTPEASSTEPVNAISFLNSSTGFVSNGAKIYKTTDGGSNWTSQTPGFITSSLYFNNSNIVFAGGNTINPNKAIINRSTDGGQTWVNVLEATDPNVFVNEIGRIDFPDANTGYAMMPNTNRLFRSVDGGSNWSSLTVPTLGTIQDFDFSTSDKGHVITSEGEIMLTIDGGVNWTIEYTTDWGMYGPSVFLSSIDFSGNTGFVGASSGLIKKYTMPVSTGVNLSSVKNSINIYPNPVSINGSIAINGETPFEDISIMDSQGRVVANRRINNAIGNVVIDLALLDLKAGVYFVNVLTEGESVVRKVIIK